MNYPIYISIGLQIYSEFFPEIPKIMHGVLKITQDELCRHYKEININPEHLNKDERTEQFSIMIAQILAAALVARGAVLTNQDYRMKPTIITGDEEARALIAKGILIHTTSSGSELWAISL